MHLFLSLLPVAEAQDGPTSRRLFARLQTNGQALQLQLLTNTAAAVGPRPQAATTVTVPNLMTRRGAAPGASHGG